MSYNCDGCNASKYAGFSKCDNETEFCLLFGVKLDGRANNTTTPCKECGGIHFKKDE